MGHMTHDQFEERAAQIAVGTVDRAELPEELTDDLGLRDGDCCGLAHCLQQGGETNRDVTAEEILWRGEHEPMCTAKVERFLGVAIRQEDRQHGREIA